MLDNLHYCQSDLLTDGRSSLPLCAGDDEQSDWFFEGDCGVGTGVAGLLPSWDSDSQLPLEDNHSSAAFLQPARLSDRGCKEQFCLLDIVLDFETLESASLSLCNKALLNI